MLMILIDAVTLVVLLKVVHDEDAGWLAAALLGLGAAVVTGIISLLLWPVIGLGALAVAGIVGAVGVGFAVALMYGLEVKRALMVGGIFMAVHIVCAVGLNLLLSTPGS
jgi:hypothetical protein